MRAMFLLMVLLLAGCGTAPASPPAPPLEPVVLSLEPASGPPGTDITVRIRLQEPEKAWAGGDGKSWNFQLCWDRCGPHQWGQAVWPKPAPDDKHLFIAKFQVPSYLNGTRLQEGDVQVLLSCTTNLAPDCLNQPEARTTFHLTGELQATTWTALVRRELQPVPALDRRPDTVVDPTNPDRQVRCESGSSIPNDPKGPPRLRVTADGGQTWESISLQQVRLGQMAGISGCRAVALDPGTPGTYYLAGEGHRAAPEWGAWPHALYTADNGTSWNVVPPPQGYDAPEAFLGYTLSPRGVTAWFARQDDAERPPSVIGQATADGGQSWQAVNLGCPGTGPCLWEVRAPLFSKNSRSLIRSEDGGTTWVWAEWEGRLLQTYNRGFHLSANTIEVAGAMADPESPYGGIPLLRSTDEGRTWQWVDVPEPPGGWGRDTDVRLEPDGGLLFRTPQDTRLRLLPATETWAPQ